MKDVDFKVDIRNLPFKDEEYDCIFASHVLEHIKEDLIAIAEIRRVLKSGGFAILPVPMAEEKTIEYPGPMEGEHVRAPGPDYYDRYLNYFSRVERFSSKDILPIYQPYIYEKRDIFPTKEAPLRTPMSGEKHIDIIPVCFV